MNDYELLNRVCVFKCDGYLDEDEDLEDAAQILTDEFQNDPPPGITPVEATVSNVKLVDDEGTVIYDLTISVEDYIRNCVEFDMEPYDILKSIKECAGPEIAKIAYSFMRDPDSNLKLAMFTIDEYGSTTVESYDTKVDL